MRGIPEETKTPINQDFVLITGHRGMGVTEKPRHEFLPAGNKFFPENSIEAFTHALSIGAQALECDIHVSSDSEAMVIHGSNIYQYADFIAAAGSKVDEFEALKLCLPQRGGAYSIDILKVENYKRQELQECFALKSYDVEIELPVDSEDRESKTEKPPIMFDALTGDDKRALEGYQINNVTKQKLDLLHRNPQRAQIPTLTQLLQVIYEANLENEQKQQPFVKLNIELKGRNSAIASIFSIIKFYKENPNAKKYVQPRDIIFLGRIAIGEIAIAHALINNRTNESNNPDLGITQLRDYYTTILQNPEFLGKCDNDFAIMHQQKQKIIQILTVNNLQAHANNTMLPTIFVLACLQSGQDLSKIFDANADNPPASQKFEEIFPILVEKTKKELQTLVTNLAKPDPEAKSIESPKQDKNEINGQIQRLAKAFNTPHQKQEYIDNTIKMALGKANIGTEIKPQLIKAYQKFTGIKNQNTAAIAVIIDAATCIHGHLNSAKTNLMVSTGDLFGEDNVGSNFNVSTDITDISPQGRKIIEDALVTYRYNGIDISLFDFCKGVYATIEECIEKTPLDRNNLIFGATASNWKATKLENTALGPNTAMLRAQQIAEKLRIPMLLKVDEPGIFADIYSDIKKFQAQGFVYGKEGILSTNLLTIELPEETQIKATTPERDKTGNHIRSPVSQETFKISPKTSGPVQKPERGAQLRSSLIKKKLSFEDAIIEENSTKENSPGRRP